MTRQQKRQSTRAINKTVAKFKKGTLKPSELPIFEAHVNALQKAGVFRLKKPSLWKRVRNFFRKWVR